jgi:hypothetical protein
MNPILAALEIVSALWNSSSMVICGSGSSGVIIPDNLPNRLSITVTVCVTFLPFQEPRRESHADITVMAWNQNGRSLPHAGSLGPASFPVQQVSYRKKNNPEIQPVFSGSWFHTQAQWRNSGAAVASTP